MFPISFPLHHAQFKNIPIYVNIFIHPIKYEDFSVLLCFGLVILTVRSKFMSCIYRYSSGPLEWHLLPLKHSWTKRGIGLKTNKKVCAYPSGRALHLPLVSTSFWKRVRLYLWRIGLTYFLESETKYHFSITTVQFCLCKSCGSLYGSKLVFGCQYYTI